jgi:NitT/TauT family transport system substrate-binding protein
MPLIQTRRHFLTGLPLAGAAAFIRSPRSLAAEGTLETTTVRIGKLEAICLAPQYVSEELLRAEGFAKIDYVEVSSFDIPQAIGRGEADFSTTLAVDLIQAIDAGLPIVGLAGVHVGCYELFAKPSIHRLTELRGKRVAAKDPLLFKLMAAQVGLDPTKDIDWVTSTDPAVNPLELFAQGKVDAFLGFPPDPQELRARQVGNVIVSTAVDRPWSQYFCCMLTGNRDYVRNHPVATKRVMPAILKAADLCATEPERVARRIVDGGFTKRYDYALQTLKDLPYGQMARLRCRGHDPLLRAPPA